MTSFPVFDAHVDLGYYLRAHAPDLAFSDLTHGHVTPRLLAEGAVRVVVNAFYTPDDACDALAGPGAGAAFLQTLVEHARARLTGFTTARDAATLRRIMEPDPPQNSSTAAPPALLFMVENADPLLEYPLEMLLNLGVRVVGLTHAGANRLADGNGVAAPGGLRPLGRTLLSRLDAAGMAVDVAHLARPALTELPEAFAGPLCSTHTGFAECYDIPRNITAETIRLIISRGGVTGLALAPEMLAPPGETADLELVYRHVDWYAQRFGVESLGLGSDFGGFPGGVAGLEDASRFPRLAERLLRAGYAEVDVAAIFGGNWLRFHARLLDEAASPA